MSGAKNCPETPRQKMIGMMYLVLTAMLALNVSADIVNGFTKLRHSMETSMEATNRRTNDIVSIFRAAYEKDDAGRAKYGDWWAVAQAVEKKSDEFYNYIERFKLDIASGVDGEDYTKMPASLKNGTDTHYAHRYALMELGPSGKTHGEELEDMMDDYRRFVTEAESQCIVHKRETDPKFAHEWDQKTDMFGSLFNTDEVVDVEGNTLSWATSIFSEMPAAAVTALLTKYQNDVYVAKNDFINFLYGAAGSSQFVVNSVEPLIMPTYGDYVMQGQSYRARIVSAMVDTNQVPRVFINGQEYEGGVYEVPARALGPQTYTGYMLIGDDTTHYEFEGKYTVGAPSAAIANMDLNMMYSGYDNVFRISVPGYGDDKLIVRCPGATIQHKGADWIINPAAGKEATIDVYVRENGKEVKMGGQAFRVRPLPSPSVCIGFGGQESDSEKQQKKILTSGAITINASYGPDSPIKAKFDVQAFAVKFPNGQEVKCAGNKMSAEAIKLLKTVKPGNIIAIRHVVAKGPDGKPRELKTMSVELQ